MLCYRDITFCPFHGSCRDGKDCDRTLTEEVKAEAVRWWGGEGAPIAQFTDQPDCYQEKGHERT